MARIITLPRFERDLKQLRKKFPDIREEVNSIEDAIIGGAKPGDFISGVGYETYKVRLANPSAGRGKSGGFRLVYYVYTPERVYFLTVYSKTQRTDVTPAFLRRIIQSEIDFSNAED